MRPKTNKLRILFVDDEPLIGKTFKLLVEGNCHAKVHYVTNAKCAIDALSVGKYDLMVTDILMPDIDGIELTEIVRKNWNIPVIIITGYAPKDVLPLGFDEHAVCCISKPYTLSEVRDKIHEALRRFRNGERKKTGSEEESTVIPDDGGESVHR